MKHNRIAVFGAALVLSASVGSCSRSTSPTEQEAADSAITVTVPSNLAQLQPALVELIRRQVQAVRSTQHNAEAHATLGLIYEANHLSAEARDCYEAAQSLQPANPTWPHRAAIAAIAAGEFDASLSLLRDAADRFPNFAPIQHRLGEALLKTGAYEEAANAFDRTIAITPAHCVGYVGLGDVNLRRGRNARAVELLARAVKLAPQYKKARYLLGLAYRAVGREEDAREQLRLGIGARTLYLQDAWGGHLRKYNVSISTAIQTSAERSAAGRNDEAVQVLEDALQFHPNDVDLLTKLGTAYLQSSRADDALRVFLRANEIDEGHPSIPINLVTCYLRLERVEDALREADRAVDLSPNVWQSHFNRGVVLMRLRRLDEARVSLLAAVGLGPDEPMVYRHLGDVCKDLGLPAEGRSHYETAVSRWPDYLPAHLGLASACMDLADWQCAKAAVEAARRLAPTDPTVIDLAKKLDAERHP